MREIVRWTAPEVIHKRKYSTQCDVWVSSCRGSCAAELEFELPIRVSQKETSNHRVGGGFLYLFT